MLEVVGSMLTVEGFGDELCVASELGAAEGMFDPCLGWDPSLIFSNKSIRPRIEPTLPSMGLDIFTFLCINL